MAIAYISGSSLTYGAGRTSTVVPAPAGIANGHTLLAWLFGGYGSATPPPATTPPAGWTKFGTDLQLVQGAGIFAGRIEMWWKRAASESGSYTWTHVTENTACFIDCFSGAKSSGVPLGATSVNSGTAIGSGQITATGLSITTTAANSWLLFHGIDWGDQSNNLSPPAGMTERADMVLLYGAGELRATAGATGDRSHLCNSVNNGSPWGVRMTELLEDAPAGGLMKVWNGSAWVEKPVKVWDGAAWNIKPVKHWNGSAWVLS